MAPLPSIPNFQVPLSSNSGQITREWFRFIDALRFDNLVSIPTFKVLLVDKTSNVVTREWFRFLLSLIRSSDIISIPTRTVPIVNNDGIITREWFRFLAELSNMH